jgi:hypothetical protein
MRLLCTYLLPRPLILYPIPNAGIRYNDYLVPLIHPIPRRIIYALRSIYTKSYNLPFFLPLTIAFYDFINLRPKPARYE